MKSMLTPLLAIASVLAPVARAQYYIPGQDPIYYNASAPAISYAVSSTAETIGMRQEKTAQPIVRHALVQPGMSPAWFGIASALDTMATLDSPQKILAAGTIASSIRSAPTADPVEIRLCQMRVQASENSIDLLQTRSVVFSGDTQAQLNDATRELNARRAQLEDSLAAAASATPETWAQTRAAIADNYSRYSEAAARVQRLTSS